MSKVFLSSVTGINTTIAFKSYGAVSAQLIEVDSANTAVTVDIDASLDGETWSNISALQKSFTALTLTINDADIDLVANTFTETSHGLLTGDKVFYEENAGFINELTNGTTYYAIVVDANTIKLATTYDNAVAGTEIDITAKNGADGYTLKRKSNIFWSASEIGEAVPVTFYRARVNVTSGTFSGTFNWATKGA